MGKVNSIFYFEDEEEEARKFARILYSLHPEICGTESMVDIFQGFNVQWESSYEAAVKRIEENTYDLYVVDLDVKLRGMLGMELVKKIHNVYTDECPMIWVYSVMSHYEESMMRRYGVAEFFVKGTENRLRRYLRLALGIKREDPDSFSDEVLRIQENGRTVEEVLVKKVICLIAKGHKFELRLIVPDMLRYHEKFYYRQSNLFEQVSREMEAGQYGCLHHVARGIIINENMINRVYRENGVYQLEMYQKAGVFTIGRKYISDLKPFLCQFSFL